MNSTFQIHPQDAAHLCCQRRGARFLPLSPWVDLQSLDAHTPAASPEAIQQMLDDPAIGQALAILESPQIRLSGPLGGGMLEPSYLSLCCSAQAAVLVSPSYQGSFLVQLFEDRSQALSWMVEMITSDCSDGLPFLPEHLPLESLVYAFHGLDCFRRVVYESMLEGKPDLATRISLERFQSTLALAGRSADVRWLMPAFLRLTPGLADYPLDPQAQHLELLVDHDLLWPGTSPAGPVLAFAPPGRLAGIDFLRTWSAACGLELAVGDEHQVQVLERAFVATTSTGNHFFRLEGEPGQPCGVHYQSLGRPEVQELLRPWLERAPVAPPAAQARHCLQCNQQITDDSKFCANCGAPQEPPAQPAVRHCRCGAEVVAAAKFCGQCGQAV